MSSTADRTRRGFTLAEVLIAMVVSAAISGLLLGILIETRSAVLRGQRRVEMATEASTILNHLQSGLVAAVPPTSLDCEITTGTLAFESDRFSFVSSRRYDGRSLIVTEIAEAPETGRVVERTRPFRQQQITTPAESASGLENNGSDGVRALGAGVHDEFISRIRFRYSTETSTVGDLEPVYLDRLPEGLYPRLVRVEIRITDQAEEPSVEYEIVTVCPMP